MAKMVPSLSSAPASFSSNSCDSCPRFAASADLLRRNRVGPGCCAGNFDCAGTPDETLGLVVVPDSAAARDNARFPVAGLGAGHSLAAFLRGVAGRARRSDGTGGCCPGFGRICAHRFRRFAAASDGRNTVGDPVASVRSVVAGTLARPFAVLPVGLLAEPRALPRTGAFLGAVERALGPLPPSFLGP